MSPNDPALDRIASRLNTRSEPLRVDANGQPWERRPEAPAHVRQLGERPYSITGVVRGLIEGRPRELAPLEWEISERLRGLGFEAAPRSVLVPIAADSFADVPGREGDVDRLRRELKGIITPAHADPDELAAIRTRRKAMDPNDDTAGGSLVPLPAQGEHIRLLRATPVVERAGALAVPIPPGHGLKMPKTTGAATFDYYDSNDAITDSEVSTGSVQLAPKRLAGLVYIPNDLIRYSPGVAEVVVRGDVSDGIRNTEDLHFLEGEGGGVKPLGIIRYGRSADDVPEADKVTLHLAGTVAANGDTFAIEDPSTMLALIEEANDEDGGNAWIMRPLMFSALANRRLDQGGGASTGAFAFSDMHTLGGEVRKQLRGLPVYTTTQVNKTSRKGSGTALTYVLGGNFRQALIGRVGVVEIAVSEHVRFNQDQTAMRVTVRSDFGMRHAQSFVLCPTLIIG